MTHAFKRLFLITVNFLILFLCFLPGNTAAQGNLLITPRRVIFDGNKKSEEISLANIGKDSATYMISFMQIKMNDDGKFEAITKPEEGQMFADKNLRFFPRSVTLAPNETQTVKVQLIKSGELQPGEYRSHLYMRASPAQTPLGEEANNDNDSMLSVKLTAVFGISIPIIIRKGDVSAEVAIPNVEVKAEKDSTYSANITFSRTGNISVYGDVFVDYISPYGTSTRVGAVRGMAVYTPTKSRRFHMVLDKTSVANYTKGKLRVTYYDQSVKPKLLAETTIDLK